MQHRNITGDSFFCWDGDVLIVNCISCSGMLYLSLLKS